MDNEQTTAALAASYVNNTNCHIFLTGKAGTGKTTFLRGIKERTHKNCIIAAPTGVAAINAGGVTLHSLFQLPFGTFIPSNPDMFTGQIDSQVNTPDTLKKNLKINTTKRRMLNEMELLIIDEVSMLRADILDAIDLVLRIVRRKRNIPFGGVQLLMIGDMLQLPPVVKNYEWPMLSKFYNSAYFFDALALQQSKPVYIELEKIYRQSDQEFIKLLAHLRDNKLDHKDISLINRHYIQAPSEEQKTGAVFLTTHNHQADNINRKYLNNLKAKPYHFHAETEGDFPDYYYPVEETLTLKKGAQVMFIKNDYSGENRYYNGKIGIVSKLGHDKVEVEFSDDPLPVEVESYTWENKRYRMNEEKGEIEEKLLGSFTHLPLKLAWAITIHKSQGLTFEKAIIDVSKAFAPGQIYVALSRLRSLDGLILTAPLPSDGIAPDSSLVEFSKNKEEEDALKEKLKAEAFNYAREYLLRAFDFNGLTYQLREHVNSYNKTEGKSEKQSHKPWAVELRKKIDEPAATAQKFCNQIKIISRANNPESIEKLEERVKAATEYFEPLLTGFSDDINKHIAELGRKKGIKKYVKELIALESVFYGQLRSIFKAEKILDSLKNDSELTSKDLRGINERLSLKRLEREKEISATLKEKKSTGKPKKGASAELSYEMFKEGKTLEEIATERQYAVSTIEGHLAQYVAKGEIPATKFVDKTKCEQIIKAYKAVDSSAMGDIKSVLGDEFTYSDIRFAMADYFSKEE